MLLTGKAKKDFLVWLYSEYDFTEKTFNELYPENLKEWFTIQWLDIEEIHIHIEPHIGGGCDVYYPYVMYWKGRNTFNDAIDNLDSQYLCFSTRTEATKQAIIKANHTYNNR